MRGPASTVVGGTAVLALLCSSVAARATDGDLYARGVRYCASTYAPGHDTPRRFGPPIDLNAAGGDYGRPVHAPTDGIVRVFSRTGIYGKSIVWRSSDGIERIHVAHLSRFVVRRGPVRADEVIGRAGSSGHAFGEGHVHSARQVAGRPAPLVLSGRTLAPGACYVSAGPITARCLDQAATIVGSARGDRLIGTAGDDVIAGLGGDDSIRGEGGNDAICGDAGADGIRGGAGDDRLGGGDGDDVLAGGEGQDVLDGGPGVDTCENIVEASACEQ